MAAHILCVSGFRWMVRRLFYVLYDEPTRASRLVQVCPSCRHISRHASSEGLTIGQNLMGVQAMYERLLITFTVIVFFGALLMVMKRRQIILANRASRQSDQQTCKPTIVYFGSNACAVCKRTQRPILDKILAEYGNEQLLFTAYDVDESPDVAKKWRVMTLPTTFLLDSAGTIKHINNGLIVSENLRKQLEPMIAQRINNE